MPQVLTKVLFVRKPAQNSTGKHSLSDPPYFLIYVRFWLEVEHIKIPRALMSSFEEALLEGAQR